MLYQPVSEARKRGTRVLESSVERYLRERIEGLGGRCFKLVDKIGMPDRLVILNGQMHLVELKRPKGGRLSRVQRALHAELAEAGVVTAKLKNRVEVDEWIGRICDPIR